MWVSTHYAINGKCESFGYSAPPAHVHKHQYIEASGGHTIFELKKNRFLPLEVINCSSEDLNNEASIYMMDSLATRLLQQSTNSEPHNCFWDLAI